MHILQWDEGAAPFFRSLAEIPLPFSLPPLLTCPDNFFFLPLFNQSFGSGEHWAFAWNHGKKSSSLFGIKQPLWHQRLPGLDDLEERTLENPVDPIPTSALVPFSSLWWNLSVSITIAPQAQTTAIPPRLSLYLQIQAYTYILYLEPLMLFALFGKEEMIYVALCAPRLKCLFLTFYFIFQSFIEV